MISISVNCRQNDWADHLGLLQFALIRHTVKNRDDLTPFLISQCHNPFGPTDFTLPANVTQQNSGETIDFHKRQRKQLTTQMWQVKTWSPEEPTSRAPA